MMADMTVLPLGKLLLLINKSVVLNTEWLPWLQSSWTFTLVVETDFIRQPENNCPNQCVNNLAHGVYLKPPYTDNPQNICEGVLQLHFIAAVSKFHAF